MTLTELQALSPDELRVRVAEIAGTFKECPQCGGYGEIGHGSENRICPCDYGDNDWWTPDYLNDLNACREFEDAMTDEEHNRFRDHLWSIVGGDEGTNEQRRRFVSATPLQKCQAYILTKQPQ